MTFKAEVLSFANDNYSYNSLLRKQYKAIAFLSPLFIPFCGLLDKPEPSEWPTYAC